MKIFYLYNVKIRGGRRSEGFACKDSNSSLQPNFPFTIGKEKFACKDRGFYPLPPVYLYNVKIGNFPEILMSSLIWAIPAMFPQFRSICAFDVFVHFGKCGQIVEDIAALSELLNLPKISGFWLILDPTTLIIFHLPKEKVVKIVI